LLGAQTTKKETAFALSLLAPKRTATKQIHAKYN